VSVVNDLVNIGRNVISLMAVATLLFSLHWAVGLILLAASAPGVLMRVRFAEKKYRWQRERTPVDRKAHYFRMLLTTDRPAKEVRIFGLGPLLIGWY
jgi:ATP-binding cassette subfamily B protein